MHYVYLLRSEAQPKEHYVGCTTDLKQRIVQHNNGESPHTAKFVPWRIVAYFAFTERKTAVAFERYLKSGSGRAFARRHFR
jgi:putative endonuclease